MIKPRQPAPALTVQVLDDGTWTLADQTPRRFSLIVVYRGLHCPICGTYLADLDSKVDAFRNRGVEPIAISSDDLDRAAEARDRWGLSNLTIGYGLDLDTAREWGLFVSSSRGMTSAGIEEPHRFAEPGLFLVRPDGTLYAAAIQTMPFARPGFGDLLTAIDTIVKKDYPARGEI